MPGKPLYSDVRFWRDENLPGVEARLSSYRHQAFRTHLHAEYSVGLIEHGSTRFTLGNAVHRARAGHIVLINPDEPHACNPDTEDGISYRMFYLAPSWLAGAANATPPRFTTPVIDNPALYAAWRELHEAFVWGATAQEKSARLALCLRQLLDSHPAPKARSHAAPPVLQHTVPSGTIIPPSPSSPTLVAAPAIPEQASAISRARAHLASSVGSWVTLADLAQVAGLSPHHFARTFKASTGLPPHAYQIQLALDHAKRLLNAGAPISQAALDAGFADQSHFSRCFRQFTGATPRQYVLNRPCDNWPDSARS